MSDSIRRRSSSRQLLQNLIRVTAQRSQEDAEEIERERRRRAREKQRGERSPSWLEPTQQNHYTQNTESDEELKPSCSVGLDEDEGFSDWSHRLETRNEQEMQNGCRAKEQRPSASPPNPQSDQHQVDEEGQEEAGGLEPRSRTQDTSTEAPVKTSNDKKEVRTSYSSSVFLAHDTRLQHTTCRPADMTSYLAAGTMKPRYAPYSLEEACRVKGEVEVQKEQEEKNENNKHEQEREEEEVQPTLQKERRPTESRQTPRDDEQEEEADFTHEVKEDLHHIREWRHRDDKNEAREDNEEERTLQNKRLTDSRDQWSELENRSSAISLCNSSEGEESLNCYGPMSPTFKKLLIQFYPDEVSSRVTGDGKFKITERTQSLRRSTSNIKKTLPPLPVSKIDKRLEQYTHALELSSKEGRSGCQTVTDLTAPTEPVASKKNLFEAGDAWNQNATSITASKDADALKVGVADLINQWVKGSEDGSRCSSPSKPAEINPGGVLNKKNLWESLGDTLSSGKEGKESSTGKRYKFVVTGHGKYEKVSVDSGCSEDINCQSAGHFYEDL